MKDIVQRLIRNNKTISTMESCTGGFVVNEITNISGSSKVLCFSAVTYSNEYKEKMGVDKKVIDKYTVYSIETAHDMAKIISNYTKSDYGIGITGKLNKADQNNETGEDNKVYISVYDKEKDKFYDTDLYVTNISRKKNKKQVFEELVKLLKKIII